MRVSAMAGRIGNHDDEAWRLHALALEARARGEDVIVLTIGDPDHESPQVAAEAAIDALMSGDTHYVDTRGKPALRQAIARRHAARTGQAADPDDITILSGAQGGIFASAMCLFGPGDEVVIPDPAFVSYAPAIVAAGARPVAVPVLPGNLRVDIGALRAAVGPHTRGIMFADPANPTGAIMRLPELEAIADLARRHDLWLVSDEIYSEIAWGAPHIGIASLPDMAGRTVVIDGVGKSHAMTGWRLGWTVAPPAVACAIAELSKLMQYGIPGFVQEGGLAAILHGNDAVDAMRTDCRRRAGLVVDALAGCPALRCLPPEAGMYVVADASASGLSAAGVARQLWNATGVAVLDGARFGSSLNRHLRISLAADDNRLLEACRRIKDFCARRNFLSSE